MTLSIGGHRTPVLPQPANAVASGGAAAATTALHGATPAKTAALAAGLKNMAARIHDSAAQVASAIASPLREAGRDVGEALKHIRRRSAGREGAAAAGAALNKGDRGSRSLEDSVQQDIATIVKLGKSHGAAYPEGLLKRLEKGEGKASASSISEQKVFENTKFLARVLKFRELASQGKTTVGSLKEKAQAICDECVAPPSDGGFDFSSFDALPASASYDDVKINISGKAWTSFQEAKAEFDKLPADADASRALDLFNEIEKEIAKLIHDHVSH